MPRTVYMLWFQGWDDAPSLAQVCRQRWIDLNPGWSVRSLSLDNLAEVTDVGGLERLLAPHPAAASDVVRSQILRDHGGVWADATTFCVRPLDDWLPSLTRSGFFAFSRPGYRRMLSTWFLAAEPGSELVSSWAEAVKNYWRDRSEPHTYFWFHHLFAELYDRDACVRRVWRATPDRPAAGPQYFSPYDARYTAAMSRRTRARLQARRDPLYKLTNRPVGTPSELSAAAMFLDGRVPAGDPLRVWSAIGDIEVRAKDTAKTAVNRVRSGARRRRLGGAEPRSFR